jgi:signal transduction histidine kinase
MEDPALWKYQNHNYNQMLRDRLPQNQVATIQVLDEVGQPIADYEQETHQTDEWWNRYAPIGSAPIIFNNHKIGTVQVKLSQDALLEMTGACLFLSITVGTSLAVLVYFFPVKVVAGMERQIQKLIHNIQHSTAQSERLRAAAKTSEQLFHNQRNFINDASHELQTPITIVRGHLELLNEEISPEQCETVELVIDELDRMSRIVKDLLLLAKAEQPDFLYLEIVELSSLTEEIYLKATALGLRHWQLDAKAVGRIALDRQRLTQAIINLAQNATQHTTESDVIALGSALTNDSIRFWVRDTGEGVAFEDQERIFQRFARGSHSCRRSEGAGLGLAIVRAIAEAHGGMVELNSRPSIGSTFTVVIPLEPF